MLGAGGKVSVQINIAAQKIKETRNRAKKEVWLFPI